MNRHRQGPRDNRNRDRMGRNNYGIGGDGLLGEGPSHGGPPGPLMGAGGAGPMMGAGGAGPMMGAGGAGPMMGGNPLGLRDSQLALAQSLIQQQQLVHAGFGGGAGADFGGLGALAGGMHFLQQQQQHQMRPPPPMMGGMGGMLNDRKRSGGQLKRENDEKRGRRDSWGRGERDRSHGNNSRSGQDRNRPSRWESDKDKKRHGEDYDPAEPTEDDDEGGNKGNDSSNLYCHVCGVSVYDEESFQRHLNGLKHKARMESIASVHQMRSTQLTSRMKAEEHLRNIERKGGRDPDYFCKICNNDLAMPWEKHRYSNIHKQRLLQVRKGCGWCKVHDFTNFTEVLEHRETEQHKKNSELYGKKDEEKDRHSIKDGKEKSSDKKKKTEESKEEEEEEEEDLTIPEYNAETPVGLDYVIPVTGYFCKLCHKFYNKKSAKATHCQTMPHYTKFKEALEEKIAAREKKREEERLRKEKEAEEAMEEGGEEEEEEEEEETNDGEEGQDEDGKKDGVVDENGDHEAEEDKAMEEEEEGVEEHDDDILDEEEEEDIGGEGAAGDEEEEEEIVEGQVENEQDLSGSIGGDEGGLMGFPDDLSTVNATMESTSFMYVPGDKVNKEQDEKEASKTAEIGNEAEDDALADVVTSELSQTSLNSDVGDDDLDLSVPVDSPAMTTSTPVVVEEVPAAKPSTRGKGTAKRGRGRGRAKK